MAQDIQKGEPTPITDAAQHTESTFRNLSGQLSEFGLFPRNYKHGNNSGMQELVAFHFGTYPDGTARMLTVDPRGTIARVNVKMAASERWEQTSSFTTPADDEIVMYGPELLAELLKQTRVKVGQLGDAKLIRQGLEILGKGRELMRGTFDKSKKAVAQMQDRPGIKHLDEIGFDMLQNVNKERLELHRMETALALYDRRKFLPLEVAKAVEEADVDPEEVLGYFIDRHITGEGISLDNILKPVGPDGTLLIVPPTMYKDRPNHPQTRLSNNAIHFLRALRQDADGSPEIWNIAIGLEENGLASHRATVFEFKYHDPKTEPRQTTEQVTPELASKIAEGVIGIAVKDNFPNLVW